jgi:Zn-dependent peptidase ImmA (M78 family)/transcriptional regulator with XRE-family HTH domain
MPDREHRTGGGREGGRRPQLSLFVDGSGSTRLDLGDIASLFLPARLTQARVLAGLTKREVADRVGVSAQAVGQWEAGLSTPRPENLADLARSLRVDAPFFASGRPHKRLDTADAHFRSLRSMRASDRARSLATVEQVWELTCALENYVQLPEPYLPEVPPGSSPADAARLVRSHWDQRRGPFRHFIATAESNGVVVVHADLDYIERVDAFSAVVAGRPIIVTTQRRSQNVFDHRFSSAHELGHLLLHSDEDPDEAAVTALVHTREQEADAFAAELLTPAAELRSLLPERMDLAALDRLSREWGVEVKSLVRRMSELRVVSDATVRRAYVKLASTKDLRPIEAVHAYAGERPQMLTEAVRVAESVGHGRVALAHQLRWPARRIDDLLGEGDPRPSLSLTPEPDTA